MKLIDVRCTVVGLGLVLAVCCLPSGSFPQDEIFCPSSKSVAGDGTPGNAFGHSVSVGGDLLVVGARWDDDFGEDAGSAYVFRRIGGSWIQKAKLIAIDTKAYDTLGAAVATDGTTVIVGAPSAGDNTGGKAYVFEDTPLGWAQTAGLIPTDASLLNEYGVSVALFGDTAVIGARSAEVLGAGSPGAAYVFERQGGGWIETAVLTSSDGASGDRFGASVSISGTRVLIGAWGADDLATDSGSAYVFEKQGASWVEVAELITTGGASGDRFGFSVSLSGDRALIGADGYGAQGAAFVFEPQGAVWVEKAQLLDPTGSADQFGYSVWLEGGRAVVGDPRADPSQGNDGLVVIFEEAGGTWPEAARIVLAEAANGEGQGWSACSIGTTVVLGAPFEDSCCESEGAVFSVTLDQPLFACPQTISESAGGAQSLDINAGPAFAGDLYLVLGSMTGTEPGFVFGGFTIPLNMDPYFDFTLDNANNPPPLVKTFAPISAEGEGLALFDLPPGFLPVPPGIELHHAYAVLDPATFTIKSVSNPVSLLIEP